jgi:hypothetical protein
MLKTFPIPQHQPLTLEKKEDARSEYNYKDAK